MEAVHDAPYLKVRPESFVNSADVILRLDMGETFPAHSVLLSFHSDVFSDMLSLSRLGESPVQVLAIPDCTVDAALSLLQCIYAKRGADRFTLEEVESVIILANKFGMDGTLNDVDTFLADKVAPDGSSSALWVRAQFLPIYRKWYHQEFDKVNAQTVLLSQQTVAPLRI